MSDTYTAIYSGGELLLSGRKTPAGSLAALALNLSREAVAGLEALCRRTEEGAAQRLSRALSSLDFISGAVSGELTDGVGAVDDIVCFRVYVRRFLSGCTPAKGAEDFRRFCTETDNLAAQLRPENKSRRTVLSLSMRPAAGFVVEGGKLCERLDFSTLRELLIYDLFRAMTDSHTPRPCRCCGTYFVPTRSGEIYCTGAAPGGEGKSCREIGARRRFAEKLSNNDVLRLYRSACGRVYTRKSRGGINAEEADEMIALCTKLRDSALAGEITVDQLGEQLLRATRKR